MLGYSVCKRTVCDEYQRGADRCRLQGIEGHFVILGNIIDAFQARSARTRGNKLSQQAKHRENTRQWLSYHRDKCKPSKALPAFHYFELEVRKEVSEYCAKQQRFAHLLGSRALEVEAGCKCAIERAIRTELRRRWAVLKKSSKPTDVKKMAKWQMMMEQDKIRYSKAIQKYREVGCKRDSKGYEDMETASQNQNTLKRNFLQRLKEMRACNKSEASVRLACRCCKAVLNKENIHF
jgi:hypothetical protein